MYSRTVTPESQLTKRGMSFSGVAKHLKILVIIS